MQKEAEQRVREMQSRARLLGKEQPVFQNPSSPRFQNPPQNPVQNISGVFERMDGDSLLILALLWILYNEKADSKLLLALLYLLL